MYINDWFFSPPIFSLQDDCQNYIRVLAKTNATHLLVCGTNAYRPMCRYYYLEVRWGTIITCQIIRRNFCPSRLQSNALGITCIHALAPLTLLFEYNDAEFENSFQSGNMATTFYGEKCCCSNNVGATEGTTLCCCSLRRRDGWLYSIK